MTAEKTTGTGTESPIISVLTADRACVTCGFNLVGQTVARDTTYRMLIVRCPECSAVASLQEYPILGKWAARWGALMAAAWLTCLLLWSLITVATFTNMAFSTASEASAYFAQYIAESQIDASKIELDEIKKSDPELKSRRAQTVNFIATQSVGPYSTLDSLWWGQQDKDALFAKAGGWRHAVNWGAASGWVYSSFVGVGMGMVWSVCLAHVRGARLLVVPLIVAAVAIVFSITPELRRLVIFDPWGQFQMGGPYKQATIAARETIDFLVMPAAATCAMLFMLIGLTIGRPLTRLAIIALLPPRRRGTLAFLWLCDGKRVPAVGPVYRAAGVPMSK